jgi:hypothetical protein
VNEVMNMQETIAKESPRRGIVWRVLAAVIAVAAVLTLGACKATGGGQIDQAVPSGELPPEASEFEVIGDYDGEANFGFNFTCEMRSANKALIQGEITYHDTGPSVLRDVETGPGVIEDVKFDPIRLHGTVDPMTYNVTTCEAAAQAFLDAAVIRGTYRSQDTDLVSAMPGRFTVLAFDQGEPGRTNDPAFVTGDGFAIELFGGPYAFYTRTGYIEGGNIQVDST